MLKRVLALVVLLLAAALGVLCGYVLGVADSAPVEWGTIPVVYPAEPMPVLMTLDLAWSC